MASETAGKRQVNGWQRSGGGERGGCENACCQRAPRDEENESWWWAGTQAMDEYAVPRPPTHD